MVKIYGVLDCYHITMRHQYINAVNNYLRKEMIQFIALYDAVPEKELIESMSISKEEKIKLYHIHIPLLRDLEIIEIDEKNNFIRKGCNFEKALDICENIN